MAENINKVEWTQWNGGDADDPWQQMAREAAERASEKARLEEEARKRAAEIASANSFEADGDIDINELAKKIVSSHSDMKEGATWNKEQKCYIGDDDGLPRDWAHLVGYLKQNPDKVQAAIDTLPKTQELSEDDIAYQKKLAEMSERDENFDPLSDEQIQKSVSEPYYHSTDPNAAGQINAKNENFVYDYHGNLYVKPGIMKDRNTLEKEKSESDEHYRDRKDWNERIAKAMEEIPQNDGEDPKEYQRRILMKLYEEIAAEQDEDENRKVNSAELNSLRMAFPRKEGESTNEWGARITTETGIRFGIGETDSDDSGDDEPDGASGDDSGDKAGAGTDDGETAGDDAEEKEADNEKLLNLLESLVLADILDDMGLTYGDLKAMDDKELAETSEQIRKALIIDLLSLKYADKLGDDITPGVLNGKSLEELIALKKEWDGVEEKGEGAEEAESPLIAVMVNRERDAKIAARAIAEEILQDRIEGKKKFGRSFREIVFGQMLRDSSLLKYEREALAAIEAGEDEVHGVEIKKFWAKEGDGAGGKVVERLTMAYVDSMEQELLHSEAGNTMAAYGVETDESGKKVVYKYSEGGSKKEAVDADSLEARSTIAVREAIEAFAKGEMTEADFEEAMKVEKAAMAEKGLDTSFISDTLLETAKSAKERFNHEESIENVMAGFRLIDANYQAQVRTEVQRSKVDEISEKISGKLGIVQPETVAAAAGIALFLTKTTTTSAARAISPLLGGALVSGTFAAFKEHNRVAVDRAELGRRLARGEEAGNTKYDQQMGETIYKSDTAKNLTSQLESAIESGDADQIRTALAVVEAMSTISDSRKIDLITFSGGENETIEDERLALDLQIARAKVELRNQGIDPSDDAKYLEASERVIDKIDEDIEEKDAAFKKLQAKRVAAQFAKTAAAGVATAVTFQEVGAVFNPGSYGIFDRVNDSAGIRFAPLNIGVNNPDARNTMLASVLGIHQPEAIATATTVVQQEIAHGAKLSDQEAQAYRDQGCIVNERQVTTYSTSETTKIVSGTEYARENGTAVSRVGWGHNGTYGVYDGNELRAYRDGDGNFYTRMVGDSWSDSMSVNTEQAVQDGRVELLISLTSDTQSTPIALSGTLTQDGTFVFDQYTSDISREIVQQGKYYLAEVGYSMGSQTASGAEEFFILASIHGNNTVGDLATTVTETIANTDTVYDVIGFNPVTESIRTTVDDAVRRGISMPFVSREHLTRGTRAEGGIGPVEPGEPTEPEGPDDGGEPGSEPDGGPTGPESTPPSSPDGGGRGPESTPPTSPDDGGDRRIDTARSSESVESGSDFSSVEDFGELGRQVTQVEFTDDQIRSLERDDGESAAVLKAKALWNGASDEERRKYIDGSWDGLATVDDMLDLGADEWTKRRTPLFEAMRVLEDHGYIGPVDRVAEKLEYQTITPKALREKYEKEMKGEPVAGSSKQTWERAKSFEPISSSNASIMVTDARIKELNAGKDIDKDTLKQIRAAISNWNSLMPDRRVITDKDGGFAVLRDYNILTDAKPREKAHSRWSYQREDGSWFDAAEVVRQIEAEDAKRRMMEEARQAARDRGEDVKPNEPISVIEQYRKRLNIADGKKLFRDNRAVKDIIYDPDGTERTVYEDEVGAAEPAAEPVEVTPIAEIRTVNDVNDLHDIEATNTQLIQRLGIEDGSPTLESIRNAIDEWNELTPQQRSSLARNDASMYVNNDGTANFSGFTRQRDNFNLLKSFGIIQLPDFIPPERNAAA